MANPHGSADGGTGPGRRAAGVVHLVGAGPGDPELLTLRALRVLEEADVVVYDRLVGPAILAYAPVRAELVFAGKAPGGRGWGQGEINRLVVARAEAGKRVVRLKGGDPFVFGRGGEEIEVLRRAGVAVEVVPGVTAALACAAAVGVPLTHRDYASRCTLVSGHLAEGALDLDWPALAGTRQTLAVYMGLAQARRLARNLMRHGLSAETPVAVVERGTLPGERLATGVLAELGDLVEGYAFAGPAMILVGEVVRLSPAFARPQVRRALRRLTAPAA